MMTRARENKGAPYTSESATREINEYEGRVITYGTELANSDILIC